MILKPSTSLQRLVVMYMYMQELMCICKEKIQESWIWCWLLELWITLPSG